MTFADDFCNSKDILDEERLFCRQVCLDLKEMFTDLNGKGYLRLKIELDESDKERIHVMQVLQNIKKVTHAFDVFFDMYVDKVKPNSAQRLRKFLELNKPFGLIEDDLRYLLYSEMIFTFLQNIEGFRCLLLFVLKLPIPYTIKTKKGDKKREIKEQDALGRLLRSFEKLKINKSDVLLRDIKYDLRNGLSHGLFWFDTKGDKEYSKPHFHYPRNVSFKNPKCVSVEDLFSEMRKQSIYSNCLLNVIADWFDNSKPNKP